MNYKVIVILLFMSIFFRCKDNSVNSLKVECDQKIIIDNFLYNNSPNDEFKFRNIEIIDDCLSITIEYGGGCGNVEAELIGSEFIEETNPPQRDISLSFKDEDYCKVLITKELLFSLIPTQIIGGDVVVLNIKNWSNPIIYHY